MRDVREVGTVASLLEEQLSKRESDMHHDIMLALSAIVGHDMTVLIRSSPVAVIDEDSGEQRIKWRTLEFIGLQCVQVH